MIGLQVSYDQKNTAFDTMNFHSCSNACTSCALIYTKAVQLYHHALFPTNCKDNLKYLQNSIELHSSKILVKICIAIQRSKFSDYLDSYFPWPTIFYQSELNVNNTNPITSQN